LLAACGSSGSDSATDAPAATPSAGGTTSAGTTGAGGAGGVGGAQTLASTSDIKVGGGEVFQDQQVVVTQPQAGQFKCFTAVCSHQGCIVANVSGGTINCDCHGSQYSIEDGSVVTGPATFPLAEEKTS